MTVSLPGEGWDFLATFVNSPAGIISFLLLIGLGMIALFERRSPFGRFPFAPGFPPFLYGLGVWLLAEFSLPVMVQPGLDTITVLARDLLVVLVGLTALPSLFHADSPRIHEFIGNVRPTAQHILLGLLSFVVLGGALWGLSFLHPFSVKISPVGRPGQGLILDLALAALLIPFVEEMIFRGYCYPLLRRYVGIAGGIVLTSMLFAGAHGLGGPWPFILAGGLLMNVLYEYTGSILPGWVLHAGFNGLVYGGGIWL